MTEFQKWLEGYNEFRRELREGIASSIPFRANDWVVCVDEFDGSLVKLGAVYRAEEAEDKWIRINGWFFSPGRFRHAHPDEIPQPVKPSRKRWLELKAAIEQLRKDIRDETLDAMRMMPSQNESLESQSERLTKKIMQHVQAWALMDKVCSDETRREIAEIVNESTFNPDEVPQQIGPGRYEWLEYRTRGFQVDASGAFCGFAGWSEWERVPEVNYWDAWGPKSGDS